MALTVRQEYSRSKQRTPRSVLRRRHGIKLFDPMAALSVMFHTPTHQLDAIYARVADQLQPQRKNLDYHASLARLDCEIEHLSPRRINSFAAIESRYPAAGRDTISRRLEWMADNRSFPAHHNVVVGLAAAYNAVLRRTDGTPFVFVPGAFDHVDESDVLVMVEHHEPLAIDGATVHLEHDHTTGVWATVVLPHTQLAIDAARSLRVGSLCGMSVCFDALDSRMVDGVQEIYRAAMYEVSLTNEPRQPRCLARLAQASKSLRLFTFFDGARSAALTEQVAECDAAANY